MAYDNLLARLAQGRVLVSDGAMGTMLHQYGLQAGECPESWCISHPDIVKGVQEAYIASGSDIVGTNSFGANSLKLRQHRLADKVLEFNRAAVALAKAAMGSRGYVAGSVGPTGHILTQEGGDVSSEEVYDVYQEQVLALAAGGVDVICLETMSSLHEAVQGIKAIKENTNILVACTFTFQASPKGFRTMMGLKPDRAARDAVVAGADIVGANCGNGITDMIEITRQMRTSCPGVPILIQPNAGVPVLENGRTVFRESPAYMASCLPALLQAGANIVGGCCGTTPDHIAALAKVLREIMARP